MEGRFYRRQPGSGILKRRLRSKGFIIGGLVALPLGFYLIFGSHGIVQRLTLESRIGDLQQRIESAEEENERLKAMSKALDSDLRMIEKVAREKYGMARKGETVYRIRKSEEGTRVPDSDPPSGGTTEQ